MKREEKLRRACNAVERCKAKREAAIKMLIKAERDLPILERTVRRLEKPVAEKRPTWNIPEKPKALVPPPDDGGIPEFLRRVNVEVDDANARIAAAKKKDDEARARIEAEQAERKRLKALARIDRLKAKKSGASRRMPLEGKAALAAIRGE